MNSMLTNFAHAGHDHAEEGAELVVQSSTSGTLPIIFISALSVVVVIAVVAFVAMNRPEKPSKDTDTLGE